MGLLEMLCLRIEVWIMNYIIGVDGGGTKTEAVAYDLDGRALATGYSGYGNVLIDYQLAIDHILEAIKQCLAALEADTCIYIYLGLAGIDSGMNRSALEIELEQLNIPYSIVNDARIAHGAVLKGQEGILTISGTGSISYGLRLNRLEMSGGWGHLLGDEGSGYWIVIECLKKMINDHETGKPISELSTHLLETLELQTVPDIKQFVYTKSKGEIAELVPVIVKIADSGDQIAQGVLEEAGSVLAEMTINLYRKLAFEGETLIGIKGSVLTRIDWVKNSFVARVNEHINGAIMIDDEVSATMGAYYLALQEMDDAMV